MKLRKRIVILLFSGIMALLPCRAGTRKVLVYMLDGMRADMMEAVNAPIWQALKENRWAESYRAAWSVDASNEPFLPTNSAPNHTAIATGRLFADHKVGDNKTFDNYDPDHAPTFLQILHRQTGASTAFAFSWMADKVLIPESPSRIIPFDDAKNGLALIRMMAADDAPDATLVFDDEPDHFAHANGFYPFSDDYRQGTERAMERLGKLLDTIKSRRHFKDEDWLIVICSDHGGYGKKHGMSGGQASTVPLLFCSKHLPAGRIAGRPCNLSITPTVLRHFGLVDEARKLPGDAPTFTIAPKKPCNLSDGLLYDIRVQDGSLANAAPHGGAFTLHGTFPVEGTLFGLGDGHVTLDDLKGSNGDSFSFAVVVKVDPESIESDPPIFSNKDWETGLNPGFCAFLRDKCFRMNFARDPGHAASAFLTPQPGRLDLWGFDFDAEQPTLIAVSVGREGMVTLFQKHSDGHAYWFSVEDDGLACRTDFDWTLGQDGPGKYPCAPSARFGGFRFWNRALSLDELQSLEIQ